jgi:hypothetical protein
MGRKLKEFTIDNHIEMAKDINESLVLLEKWQEKLRETWGINHKSSKRLDRAVNYISRDLRLVMDDGWHHNLESVGESPYFNILMDVKNND